jgi:hypothetical protein
MTGDIKMGAFVVDDVDFARIRDPRGSGYSGA